MVEAVAGILGPDRVTVLSKLDDPKALRERFGGKVKTYATGNIPAVLRTPAFALLLLAVAFLEGPDLILSTHANFSPVATWLQKWRCIPAAVSAHGVEVWDLPPGRIREALRQVRKILPVSDYTKNRLKDELHLADDRFQVIPDTFDPVRFSPGPAPAGLRERYRLRPADKVLLCVSRLVVSEQYKGYRQILEVLPSLARKVPGLKFLLVGRGNDRPNVERQIDRLGLADRVILAGFVPSQELADHYRMADAFAMPSKREGFGIVYLEAMGCGKRCLGGNKDAAVDALRHGELGILVDPDNPAELEQGLERLLTDTPPDSRKLHAAADRYFGRAAFRTKVKQLLESFGLR
jgi:glycosyltransferase involved in cell wall biosynthesis